jgi:hypothetical protein
MRSAAKNCVASTQQKMQRSFAALGMTDYFTFKMKREALFLASR